MKVKARPLIDYLTTEHKVIHESHVVLEIESDCDSDLDSDISVANDSATT